MFYSFIRWFRKNNDIILNNYNASLEGKEKENWTNWTAMFENGNTTTNGTLPSSCTSNPTAEKIGQTFAYFLIFLVSLAGNIVIAVIVYKTKTMRRPINFLIVNMVMSDLLFPIFLFPRKIQMLYIDSWLIGGPLGQVLCKLACLEDVSVFVSI